MVAVIGTVQWSGSPGGDGELSFPATLLNPFRLTYTPQAPNVIPPSWQFLGYWFVDGFSSDLFGRLASGPIFTGRPTLIHPQFRNFRFGSQTNAPYAVRVRPAQWLPPGQFLLEAGQANADNTDYSVLIYFGVGP